MGDAAAPLRKTDSLHTLGRRSRGLAKRRAIAAMVCAASCLAAPAAAWALPTVTQWTTAASGLWTEGARWSSAPHSPDNGVPSAADEYAVVVAATGSPYTVTLRDDVAIDSLTIDSPNATVALGSSRLVTPSIQIDRGTLLLGAELLGVFEGNAEIVGATITGAGSLVASASSRMATPTLDGVSLGVPLTVPSSGGSPPQSRLVVRNGLKVLANQTVVVQPGAVVQIEGSQTLDGPGQVLFQAASPTTGSGALRLSQNTVLTIGPDMAVRTMNTGGSIGGIANTGAISANVGLINYGLLSGESSTQPLQIFNASLTDGATVQNHGVIQAIGSGSTVLGGDWTNSGVLRLRDNAELMLSGVFSPSDMGVIDRQGGRLLIAGRVENSGSTFMASAATGDLELVSSWRYFHAEPTRIVGGVIDATDGAKWIFRGGDLEDVTLATGATINLGGVDIVGDLTLDNVTLSLVAGPSSEGADLLFREGNSVSQSLLGTGTVRFVGGQSNDISGYNLTVGEDITIEAVSGRGRFGLERLVNNGMFRSIAGSQIEISAGDFINRGNIEIAGDVTIGRQSNGVWTNEGRITIKPGGGLAMRGTVAVDDLGEIIDEGAKHVWLHGVLDNRGQTLDLESPDLTVPLTLHGGRIRGGIVTSSGDATLNFINDNFLDSVTLATDITISGSTRVFVENGLTLSGATLTLPEGTSLLFTGSGPQFLEGSGVLALPRQPLTSAITRISGTNLVIGAGIVIDVGNETFREVELIFKENRGTIIADSPGTVVTIGESSGQGSTTFNWRNNGVIRVAGSQLELFGSYSVEDIGTLEFVSGDVQLYGVLQNQGRIVRLDASTGPWKFRGRINGGRIETATGLVADLRGEAVGVTLAGNGVILDDLSSSAIGSLRVSDRLTLDGGRIVVGNDAELSVIGNLTIDGVGEIVLDGATTSRSLIQLGTGSRLTIGEQVTVRTSGTGNGQVGRFSLPVINHGRIVAEEFGRTLALGGSLENHGLLRTARRGLLRLDTSQFVNRGVVQVEGGTLYVNATSATNQSGGELIFLGAGEFDFTAAGTYSNAGTLRLVGGNVTVRGSRLINAAGGRLEGQGAINRQGSSPLEFVNEGLLAPGQSTGSLVFNTSKATLASGGSLEVEIGDAGPDDYDRLAFFGDLQLGGVLEVLLLDGVALEPNQEFLIALIQGARQGEFTGLVEGSVVGVYGGVPLFITYSAGNGNDVALYTIPEPAAWALLVSTLLSSASPRRRDDLACSN
jgi:hypothetical protein